MDNRIVITGVGLCCAIGTSVEEVLNSLRVARSGLKPYRCEKAPNLHARVAGTIERLPERFDKQLLSRWDRGTLLAAHAASEALAASQISLDGLLGDRVGLATGASGSGQFNPADNNPLEQPSIDSLTSKIVMQHNVPCFQTDELARHFGVHGPLVTVSSASAGSGIAIGMAMRWLQANQADFVLAGGGEGLLPLNIIGFDLLGLLDSQSCSPFSRSQGMSMGEGAAFVTLERYATAAARGAPILAQLHGFAVTSDAFDAIQFDPSGDGIRRALEVALNESGLAPTEIDWIRASGAGGASQDASELAAIATAFNEHKPLVTSLESTLGHTNGAGPAIGLVSCVACQAAELIPATLNFDVEHSSNAYDFVPNQPRASRIDTFLSTTAAFGGTNVVLVGGRPRKNGRQYHADRIRDSIVISGMGLVTPLGCGSQSIADLLLHEKCQWTDVARLGDLSTRIRQVGLVKDFEPRKLLSSLRLRGVDPLTQFAAAATKLAIQDANLHINGHGEHVGIVSAISRPSAETLGKLFNALQDTWASLTVSKALLRKGRFLIASQLANWFGCKGYTATVTEGLGASLGGLIAAANQLQNSPELNAVIVVTTDEVSPTSLRMWESLNCMSTCDGDHWQPYDAKAGGMVAGEGAVALVLERALDVSAREHQAIAEICGFAQTNDAVKGGDTLDRWLHLDPQGHWLSRAIEQSLERAGFGAGEIGLVLGNGCGESVYDRRELTAIRSALGGHVPVETINRNVGVLESSCALLGVAAAATHVQQASMACSMIPKVAIEPESNTENSPESTVTLSDPTLPATSSVMVCASSETGRNSIALIKPVPRR